jgi:hypothetical protein
MPRLGKTFSVDQNAPLWASLPQGTDTLEVDPESSDSDVLHIEVNAAPELQ